MTKRSATAATMVVVGMAGFALVSLLFGTRTDAQIRPDTLMGSSSQLCAVQVKGTVACSHLHPLNDSELSVLARVNDLDNAVKVAPQQFSACALNAAGQVWCWGTSVAHYGIELDTSTISARRADRELAMTAEPVPGLDDVVDIASYEQITCVVHRSTAIGCTSLDAEVSDQGFQPVQLLTGVSNLVVNRTEVCVSQATGAVACALHGAPAEQPKVVVEDADWLRGNRSWSTGTITCAGKANATPTCWSWIDGQRVLREVQAFGPVTSLVADRNGICAAAEAQVVCAFVSTSQMFGEGLNEPLEVRLVRLHPAETVALASTVAMSCASLVDGRVQCETLGSRDLVTLASRVPDSRLRYVQGVLLALTALGSWRLLRSNKKLSKGQRFDYGPR